MPIAMTAAATVIAIIMFRALVAAEAAVDLDSYAICALKAPVSSSHLIIDGGRYEVGTGLNVSIAGAGSQCNQNGGPGSQVLDSFYVLIAVDASFNKSYIITRCFFGNGFAEFHEINEIKYIEQNILTVEYSQLAPLTAGEIEKCHFGFH